MPYRSPQDYGRRLAGVIVKSFAEAPLAAAILGDPVHVIPNGVPLEETASAGASRQTPSPLVIGTAACVSPPKKREHLLHAVRAACDRLPPFRLGIAGGVERGCADCADALRQKAAGLPVEGLGELEDPRAFYRRLDLFAMISEPAGCPDASLEAMAAGLRSWPPMLAAPLSRCCTASPGGSCRLATPGPLRTPWSRWRALPGSGTDSALPLAGGSRRVPMSSAWRRITGALYWAITDFSRTRMVVPQPSHLDSVRLERLTYKGRWARSGRQGAALRHFQSPL